MLIRPPKGRGATENIANRFERLHLQIDDGTLGDLEHELADLLREDPEALERAKRTVYLKDKTRTLFTKNDSPDIPFNYSLNPYRGCEHGCIYCYARPTHEYLGMSAGLDFESRVVVKENAPELLRQELASPRWQPQVVALSGVTDCYQPVERYLKLTRGCLEVLTEFRNPFSVITKNALVTRDVDVFREAASRDGAAAYLSVTSLDDRLCGILEPRTSRPEARLKAIAKLSEAGVPTGVMVAPVIPGINDHEIPQILKRAAEAGARWAGTVTLRLPWAVRPLFEKWLAHHFPDRKEHVLSLIRSVRGGRLNDPRFGSRMEGTGPYAEQIASVFDLHVRRNHLNRERLRLSSDSFRRVTDQLSLFDENSL